MAISSPTADAAVPALPPLSEAIVQDRRLCWREAGTGPALVFLHGLSGSSASWRYQFAAFADRMRVIAWDAPGYGGSDPFAAAAGEPVPATYVAALAGLLRHLGARDITLVGHSMGGVLAATLAAAGEVPLLRLVLSSTHPGYAAPAGSPASPGLAERLAQLASLSPAEYGARRAAGMVAPRASAAVRELVAGAAAEARPEGLFAATRMLQFADIRPILPKLALPVLVLDGDEDRVVRPDLRAELLALTPATSHRTLAGVGHAAYLENANAYNAALADFLALTGNARRA